MKDKEQREMDFVVVEVTEHEEQGERDAEKVEVEQLGFEAVAGQAVEVELLVADILVVQC